MSRVHEFIDNARHQGFIFTLKYKLGLAEEGKDFITLGQEEDLDSFTEEEPQIPPKSQAPLHPAKPLNVLISDAQRKTGKSAPEQNMPRY